MTTTTHAAPARKINGTAQDTLALLLAGKAVFTIRRGAERFTYEIKAAKDGGRFFVMLLTGPQNTADFAYAGMIWDAAKLPALTAKSCVGTHAPSWRLLVQTWTVLLQGAIPSDVEIWHAGFCCRCGRLLTVDESIARGIGPECASKTGVPFGKGKAPVTGTGAASASIAVAAAPKVETAAIVVEAPAAPAPKPTISGCRVVGQSVEIGLTWGAPKFDEARSTLKANGARWHAEEKAWVLGFKAAAAALTSLRNLGLDVSTIEAAVKVPAAAPAKAPAAKVPAGFFAHQAAGVAFLTERFSALLADDMGLGKTAQAIVAAEQAVDPGARILVVCPASLAGNWKREIQRWSPGAQVSVLDGKVSSFDARWNVVSYDTAKRAGKLHDALLAASWGLLVIDEAHRVKNPKSQRHGFAAAVKTTRVWQLTGTPMSNRPMDLYGVLKIGRHDLARSRHGFGVRYCGAFHDGYGWDYSGASNLTELAARTSDWMLRRTKDEALDLPAKTRSTIAAEVPERRSAYKTIGEMMIARHALAGAKVATTVETALDILEVPGAKVIVFSEYIDVLDALQSALGEHGVARIDGSVTGSARQAVVDKFQGDASVRVFLGQTVAAGEGITLTAASYVIINDLMLVPAQMAQAEDRAHRIGQRSAVSVYYTIGTCALDERLWGMIQGKLDTIGSFESALVEPVSPEALFAALQAA